MARKRKTSQPSNILSPIHIGNCEISVQGAAKSFSSQSNHNSLQISASKGVKINISVMELANESKSHGLDSLKLVETDEGVASHVDCQFLLVNPKDPDAVSQTLLQHCMILFRTQCSREQLLSLILSTSSRKLCPEQIRREEILSLYKKELPAMNYAANTGKQSTFLQRCVSSGKFCSLVLSEKSVEQPLKVIAAITYQIIPADTQQAEIPLAAVSSTYQQKGIGRLLYTELKKRLQDVGIVTILCWGDKESEGFWLKQGFVSIAEVGTKGRARRLPIRADIRRALCFPGGSTLMISHLDKNLRYICPHSIKLRLDSPIKTTSSNDMFYSLGGTREASAAPTSSAGKIPDQGALQLELTGSSESNSVLKCQQLVTHENMEIDTSGDLASARLPVKKMSSTNKLKSKWRVWEISSSSLNSKRVKATHLGDSQSYSDSILVLDKEQKDESPSNRNSLGLEGNITSMEKIHGDVIASEDFEAKDKTFNIMLMDIADGPKKEYLTKTIADLGGTITTDGSLCTHVLAGKVRKTLNFCTALCSGAWILSPHWLKVSSREGRFVDEDSFILKDEEYRMKFRVDLKETVLRARKNSRGLLDGYCICLTRHVHPPVEMLSAIVRSAGGDVKIGLGKVAETSKTIFIACEEDMEEALFSVKSGVRTFSGDWLMNCIMKQELDLDAPQFAESL